MEAAPKPTAELWKLGHEGPERGLEFTVSFYPQGTCHSATLSVSELGARDVPGVGQEDLCLGVGDEALGIGSEVGSESSSGISEGCWAHPGTQLPLFLLSCPPMPMPSCSLSCFFWL